MSLNIAELSIKVDESLTKPLNWNEWLNTPIRVQSQIKNGKRSNRARLILRSSQACGDVSINSAGASGDVLVVATTGTGITASYYSDTFYLDAFGYGYLGPLQEALDSVTLHTTSGVSGRNLMALVKCSRGWPSNRPLKKYRIDGR